MIKAADRCFFQSKSADIFLILRKDMLWVLIRSALPKHMCTYNICFCGEIRNIMWIYLLILSLFVCVEVLRPSQPSGVMSSVVSVPNYRFTGQA